MPFVLDSSVTLAWLLPDEDNDAADAIAATLETDFAAVPELWLFEISNALLTAQRRGRISDGDLDRFAAALHELPIEVSRDPSAPSIASLAHLAKRLNLTAYDAAYLELAKRRSLPLATLDARLRAACAREGVKVLP